jgi:quercetin dioxygenase-like cupin family protein
MKVKLKILALALLSVSMNVCADDYSGAVKVTPLLKTTTTWDGKAIVYPKGEAQLTGMMVEIAPGGETGWHEHPVPSFEVILQGTLEITTETGQVKRVQKGESFSEVVNTKHNGRNIEADVVKLWVVCMGTTESPLTIAHPEFVPKEEKPAE